MTDTEYINEHLSLWIIVGKMDSTQIKMMHIQFKCVYWPYYTIKCDLHVPSDVTVTGLQVWKDANGFPIMEHRGLNKSMFLESFLLAVHTDECYNQWTTLIISQLTPQLSCGQTCLMHQWKKLVWKRMRYWTKQVCNSAPGRLSTIIHNLPVWAKCGNLYFREREFCVLLLSYQKCSLLTGIAEHANGYIKKGMNHSPNNKIQSCFKYLYFTGYGSIEGTTPPPPPPPTLGTS